MKNVVNFSLPKFSRNLVTWDPKTKTIVNRGFFNQLFHRIINITRPGHFNKVLEKSVRKAYLNRLQNLKLLQAGTTYADSEKTAQDIQRLISPSKIVNAEALNSVIKDYEILSHNSEISRRNSIAKNEQGLIEVERDQLEKELAASSQKTEEKRAKELEVATNPAYAKAKKTREAYDFPAVQKRQDLTREINELKQEREQLLDSYDLLFEQQLALQNNKTDVSDQAAEELQVKLDTIQLHQEKLQGRIENRLKQIDQSYARSEQKAATLTPEKTSNLDPEVPESKKRFTSVSAELARLELPHPRTRREELIFIHYKKELTYLLTKLVKLQALITKNEKNDQQFSSEALKSKQADRVASSELNEPQSKERQNLDELKDKLIEEVKAKKQEMLAL